MFTSNAKLIFYFLLLTMTLSFSLPTQAARIIQSKGKRILIQLDGEFAFVNQQVNLLNSKNKRVALATITQIRGGRAIATLVNGQIEGDEALEFIEDTSGLAGPVTPPGQKVFRVNSNKFSVMLMLANNTMTTKQTDGSNPTPNTETVSMKGTTFGLTAAYDYPLSTQFVVRLTGGFEPYSAKGTAQFLSCDALTSTNCTADINYLSGGGYLRFDFSRNPVTPWAALGATFKYPISKSTTALLANDIKTTTTFGLAAGADWFTTGANFVPFSIEYQLFQNSDTVTANIMMLRAGYGWAF